MNREKEKRLCMDFFNELAKLLTDYEQVGSCNHDDSVYLVPFGTVNQISYYGKPSMSFRVSDHWNWYSSLKKCDVETMVQCRSIDMPWAKHRLDKDKASKPWYGWQVALCDKDGIYHHVYGKRFDRKQRKWMWEQKSLQDVLAML